MPSYVYQIVQPDGEPGECFEVLQRMSDPPLTHHPESGVPVRRIVSAPALLRHGRSFTSPDSRTIAAHGFTRYEKTGDGRYTRTAGNRGPETLQRPD